MNKQLELNGTRSTAFAKSFSGFWASSLIVRTDLLRQIGGYSADISFVEDRDLHFRLSLVTSIAYVNKQLIQTDRNPSPPGSTCRPWDKVEVQFRQQQHMYEKWLRMGPELLPDIRRIIRRNLGALHSHWANWYLENARYDEARQAVSNAVRYKTTFRTTVKWALTWLAPAFASKISPKTRPYRDWRSCVVNFDPGLTATQARGMSPANLSAESKSPLLKEHDCVS